VAKHRRQDGESIGRDAGEPGIEDVEEDIIVVEELTTTAQEPLDPSRRPGGLAAGEKARFINRAASASSRTWTSCKICTARPATRQ
jgi:hypothetical protein